MTLHLNCNTRHISGGNTFGKKGPLPLPKEGPQSRTRRAVQQRDVKETCPAAFRTTITMGQTPPPFVPQLGTLGREGRGEVTRANRPPPPRAWLCPVRRVFLGSLHCSSVELCSSRMPHRQSLELEAHSGRIQAFSGSRCCDPSKGHGNLLAMLRNDTIGKRERVRVSQVPAPPYSNLLPDSADLSHKHKSSVPHSPSEKPLQSKQKLPNANITQKKYFPKKN